jgi:hypothetical protein
MHTLDMMGGTGFEPVTFPASRDALNAFVDQFLDGSVRLPRFDLPLTSIGF